MGYLKYFSLLMVAGMFAACSDNLENPGNENDGPKTGEGYVKVAINLPSVSGSRAFAEPGSLNDGTPDEYAVNDAILVFFKTTSPNSDGTSEATADETPEETAQFVKAYGVSLNYAGEDVNHVTNRHTVIGEAPLPAKGEQIYALAILNTNDMFVINATTGELKYNDSPDYPNVFTESNKKLSALQTAIETTAANCTKTGFMMLNAPLAKTSETSGFALSNVQTLVPVTVYKTKGEAEGSTDGASIYVERVVSKVTLKGFSYSSGDGKYTKAVEVAEGNAFQGDEVEFQGWTLNYTNKTTKLVRDVNNITAWLTNGGDNASRFLGNTPVDSKALYRIYWAEDCNYDVDYDGTTNDAKEAFNVFAKPEDIQVKDWNANTSDNNTVTGEDFALYCLENTMDYDKQATNQTTSLILKTKYLAEPRSEVEGAQNFFMYGTQEVTYTEEQFLAEVKTALSFDEGVTVALADVDGGTYTFIPPSSTEGEGNYLNKKDVKSLFTLTRNPSSSSLTDSEAQTLISKLGEIKFYKDGDSYYNVVLIRHFDDDATPWESGETYSGKHLGRYGVVRNNWYEINVSKITGPGEPTIVDDSEGGEPDDEEEGYIKCQINVLSWAKRQQSVDL